MKQIFTSVSLFLLIGNAAIAQEKNNIEKITIKKETTKEPCFVSEFDANGKEIKVPCGTKSATVVTSRSTTNVTVNTEIDPATGYKKYFLLEFDMLGNEVKTYGSISEEFDASGKSELFFKYKNAAGKDVLVPAKMS